MSLCAGELHPSMSTMSPHRFFICSRPSISYEDDWVGNRDACARVTILEVCHGLGHRTWPAFAFSVSLNVYNKVLKAYDAFSVVTEQEIDEAASGTGESVAETVPPDTVSLSFVA